MLQYEIDVMKMLDHPNIVRLYETFHDEDNHVMHLVMELCEGGDLLDFVLKTEIQENGTISRGSTLFSCFFNIKNSFPSSFLSFTSFIAVMSSTYLLYAVRKIPLLSSLSSTSICQLKCQQMIFHCMKSVSIFL